MSAELLAAADELAAESRARAQEIDDLRRIPDDIIGKLIESDLFRVLQPKRYGGLELDPRVFLDITMRLAAGSGSVGWVYGVLAVHNWQLALFPAQAQEDVWSDDTNVLTSSSYAPRGTATKVDGGFRLSGRWSFSSGADHCDWVILGGAAEMPDGSILRTCFLVPRGDYEVVDVWHVIGLQGTGSNDIVIEDAFVPDHRTHPFTSGSVTSDSPIYALPFSCLFTYGIAAPIIGMAEGALEDHIEHASARTRVAAARRVATEAWSQIRVADAASEVDAARAQLDRNFADMMDVAVAGGSFDVQLRARVRRDQVRAVQWCVSAIDRVFQNSGGSVLSVKNPVQRAWRDAHAGSLHNSNVPEPILSGYGAIALGLPPEDYPL